MPCRSSFFFLNTRWTNPSPHSVSVHQAWPEAEFIVVPDAGHSAMEVGITSNLIAATNKFRPAATH